LTTRPRRSDHRPPWRGTDLADARERARAGLLGQLDEMLGSAEPSTAASGDPTGMSTAISDGDPSG
jgi:hypothetical protein